MAGFNDNPPMSSPPSTIFHPAFVVSNIKNHVSVTLDQEAGQYATWVELFQITACAFDVLDHIDASVSPPKDIDATTWKRLDAIIKQWIYATISQDLVHTIMKPGATALDLWSRLEELFHDNKHTRAVYLEEQFSKIRLDQFTNMSDYCKQIKVLADQLANVDCPVSDRKMVMQLIEGLTKGEYNTVAAIVSQTEPTPSFNKARSIFILEETRLNKQDDHVIHALVGQAVASTPPTPHTGDQQRNSGRGSGRARGGHGSRGRGCGRRGAAPPSSSMGTMHTRPPSNPQQIQWGLPNWPQPTNGGWASPPCPYPTSPHAPTNQFQQLPSHPPHQTGMLGPRPTAHQAQFTTGPQPTWIGQPMSPMDLG